MYQERRYLTVGVKDILAEDFQITVDEYLKRNKNILDCLSKYQTASSRLSRAVTKASTQCGCVKITGEPKTSGIDGELCDDCRDIIEKEMGDVVFYLTAICSSLQISLYDVILNEKKTLSVLGNFSLK